MRPQRLPVYWTTTERNFGREPRLNYSRLDITVDSIQVAVVEYGLSSTYRAMSGYSIGSYLMITKL
jgi:hypothetical protein